MDKYKLSVLQGAVGGAIFGFVSMIVPVFLKPGVRLGLPIAVFVVLGTALLGAFFAHLNWQSK